MFRHSIQQLLVLATVVLAATSTAYPQSAMPREIDVPAGHEPYLIAHAEGTQNYVCLPGASGLAWKFQGPQATLFFSFRLPGRDIPQQVTTHFLSPNPVEPDAPARATWQSSVDTSAVWAKRIAESTDPNYVERGAIPWFLLEVTGAKSGPSGGSMLSVATYIQRVNTTGGMMPSAPCTEAGALQFVPYTADYVFYKAVAK